MHFQAQIEADPIGAHSASTSHRTDFAEYTPLPKEPSQRPPPRNRTITHNISGEGTFCGMC